MINKAKNLLIMPNNPLQMYLKLSQNKQFKKRAEGTGNLISN